MVTVAQLRGKYEGPIREVLMAGFEKGLLTAAFDNLQIAGPLRFNNFSYALRELLRHVLHRLAPDSEVKRCVWFRPTQTVADGITRAHRATYAIQGGLSDAFVKRKLGIDVAFVRSDLMKAIKVLNKHTHIEPSTFAIKPKQVEALAGQCLKATEYFIEHILKCRRRVAESLSNAIDQHLINQVISEAIDSIDVLATHHQIDEIYVDHIEVVDISSRAVLVRASGSIGCDPIWI
ncbi:MAG: hypothetical protein KGO52_13045 [Nitrospirota bacterium]|nr:hypothetical protein [Nitrospirota bacterium]MDE3243637.1 hypothetical protein [Nitrospirota bacterium]